MENGGGTCKTDEGHLLDSTSLAEPKAKAGVGPSKTKSGPSCAPPTASHRIRVPPLQSWAHPHSSNKRTAKLQDFVATNSSDRRFFNDLIGLATWGALGLYFSYWMKHGDAYSN